jgi:type VI secretion system protein ImpK
VVGLIGALLLGAAGYATADHWAYKKPNQPAVNLDVLASNLKTRLRDEIAAGHVVLAHDVRRNVGQSAFTLRFLGMFTSGSATVTPRWIPVVVAVGREITASTAGTRVPHVLIVGYADSLSAITTHERTNQALSEARAQQVAQILEAVGVPASRINVSGKGDTEPLVGDGTIQGRALNRRVEIVVSP